MFCVSEMFMGCSRGMGKTMGTVIMNIAAICLPRLIWVWAFFPVNRTVQWLCVCYPLSCGISAILQCAYYLYLRRKLFKMKQ